MVLSGISVKINTGIIINITDKKIATPPILGTGFECTFRISGVSMSIDRLARRIIIDVLIIDNKVEPRYTDK